MRIVTALLLTLAILTVAVPAHAGDGSLPLMITVAAGNNADLISTYAALNRPGTQEVNSFLSSTGIMPLKLAVGGAEVFAIHSLWKDGHKRSALLLTVGMTTMNLFLTVHNMRIANGPPAIR